MILIDTHIVLWLALDEDRLSSAAERAIRKARNAIEPVAISDISLWEVAFAVHKKRVPLQTDLGAFLEEIENRFLVLPITARTSDAAVKLTHTFPKDPADRIIVGTALDRGVPLITADLAIHRSGVVSTIW